MSARLGTAAVIRLERFVLWLYGPPAAWAHVLFGGLAASWALVHVFNPGVLDAGAYAAINWLPDWVWVVAYVLLIGLHATGIWRPRMRKLRALACLASAWVWLVLGLTFAARNGLTPGALVYAQVGILAVGIALYVAWSDQDG